MTLPPSKAEQAAILREKIALKEKELALREGLPFLYGWKWYPWAKKFFDSTNKFNLLTAANQVSKSSTAIRKCTNWATNKDLWPELWRNPPSQFWYLYPTNDQARIEFEKKWKRLFLPRNEYKNDPVYGWHEEYGEKKRLFALHFNSGVSVYFKTYAQDTQSLQTGTVDAIFCDEELPFEHFDELKFRLTDTDGYFHMVFTATLGQDEWRRAMDPTETEKAEGREFLPHAFKQTVSLYEAQHYTDGAPSHWTPERIQRVIDSCSTHNEVLKRVFGKFIRLDGGRKCEQFDVKRHVKSRHPLPRNWLVYCAADPGSGGEHNHPAAIVFIAVSPDFRQGRVFLGWRGDKIETTDGDVVQKYLEMKTEHKLEPAGKWYDWGAKDFGIIAARAGHPFEKADKSRDAGEALLNTLFKHDILAIYGDDPELAKLVTELSTLRKDTPKTKAKDDFYDALRYCAMGIPWDTSLLVGAPADSPEPDEPQAEVSANQRRLHGRHDPNTPEAQSEAIQDEFDEINELAGG